jgi:hypothetical protein
VRAAENVAATLIAGLGFSRRLVPPAALAMQKVVLLFK